MIFYSDVDDTLMQTGVLSEDLENFLKSFDDEKNLFVPCSGRPTSNMRNTFDVFPKIKYVIGFNGGEIIDLKNKKTIFENGIIKEVMEKVIVELTNLGLDYLYYDQEKIFTNNDNNEYAKVERDLTFLDLVQTNDIKPSIKILGLSSPDKTDENIRILKEKLPQLEIAKSKPFFIEITNKNVTKGNAVLKLNQILGKDIKNTYVFGDSNNDISMFELSAKKVAVQNASEVILNLADEICLSCKEDGVVKYIEEILKTKRG